MNLKLNVFFFFTISTTHILRLSYAFYNALLYLKYLRTFFPITLTVITFKYIYIHTQMSFLYTIASGTEAVSL